MRLALVPKHHMSQSRSTLIYAFAAINDLSVTSTSDLGDIIIPKSASKALASAHAVYWYEAIMKELAGLSRLNTWKATMVPNRYGRYVR